MRVCRTVASASILSLRPTTSVPRTMLARRRFGSSPPQIPALKIIRGSGFASAASFVFRVAASPQIVAMPVPLKMPASRINPLTINRPADASIYGYMPKAILPLLPRFRLRKRASAQSGKNFE